MVELSYEADDDVVADTELQTFVQEVAVYGFAGFPNNAHFPTSLETRVGLVEYLTAIIFNISVFHAGVNFQSFKYYGYPPNAPSAMRKSPPTYEESVSWEHIFEALPVMETVFTSMNISNILGQFSPVERFYLGHNTLLGEHMTVSPDQEHAVRELGSDMADLKVQIDSRNRGHIFKYTVLRPDNVPITTQT